MTDIESYVAELAARLRVGRRSTSRILVEVREHLEDAVAARDQAGETYEAAVAAARSAFGSPAVVASQFNADAGTLAMKRAPGVAAVAGVVVFGGFVLAASTQPVATTPVAASVATQVTFFAAALAFQVAFVAGVCAASRAATVWRAATARSRDRQFVRRCASVSIAALTTAAVGWITTTALGAHTLVHPRALTLVLGGAIMFAGVVAALAAMARLRVNLSDDPVAEPDAPATGLLTWGERVIDVIRRHPVVSCAATAVAAAIPAMSHAETTVSGALPWGVIQSAAVVLGFVLLGPTLGLRRARG